MTKKTEKIGPLKSKHSSKQKDSIFDRNVKESLEAYRITPPKKIELELPPQKLPPPKIKKDENSRISLPLGLMGIKRKEE